MKNGLHVVMGVAGSGKSLIGAALASALGVEFVEGDDFHSASNVARMAAGIPLTDDDRADWLAALADRIRQAREAQVGLVVSCSALKRSYRDVLRGGASDVQFIFLDGPRTVIAKRLESRTGHYMPPALLDSQLSTLERPGRDENVWVCDISRTPEDLVSDLARRASQ